MNQTPYYLIKENDLQYDIDLLKNALRDNWGNYICGYSVKTNSLPWLLTHLKKQDFYAEVVSEVEYDLVKRLGFTSNQIIYNGPIKDKKTFEEVLFAGGYVNLDSSDELIWLEEIDKTTNQKLNVGVRINVDLTELIPEDSHAGSNGGRFGFCYENGVLKSAVDRINALNHVNLVGLHLHSSTQSRSVEVYGALAKMAVKVAKEFGLALEYIDMGGGYFGGRNDMPSYPDYFKVIAKELKSYFDNTKVKLIVEPGVSLISRAISLNTTIIDVKHIRDIDYLVTDGSRVYLNPQVTRHTYPHHIVAKDSDNRNTKKTQWVCGSTCMEYDRLFEISNDKELKPGDKIVYDLAGGYTMCLVPQFIHYNPAVYIEHKDGSVFTAREAWTNDEYLSKNYWE